MRVVIVAADYDSSMGEANLRARESTKTGNPYHLFRAEPGVLLRQIDSFVEQLLMTAKPDHVILLNGSARQTLDRDLLNLCANVFYGFFQASLSFSGSIFEELPLLKNLFRRCADKLKLYGVPVDVRYESLLDICETGDEIRKSIEEKLSKMRASCADVSLLRREESALFEEAIRLLLSKAIAAIWTGLVDKLNTMERAIASHSDAANLNAFEKRQRLAGKFNGDNAKHPRAHKLCLDGQNSRFPNETSKLLSVWYQMHCIAKDYPNDEVHFHLIDDRDDLLSTLQGFFKAHPRFLPANVVFHVDHFLSFETHPGRYTVDKKQPDFCAPVQGRGGVADNPKDRLSKIMGAYAAFKGEHKSVPSNLIEAISLCKRMRLSKTFESTVYSLLKTDPPPRARPAPPRASTP